MQVEESKKLTRRDMRREATKSAVLTAARTVFMSRGYEATTIKEIAKEADVSPGTVMNAEPTKVSLLIAVLQSEYQDIKEHCEQLLASLQAPITEKIELLVQTVFEMHLRHHELYAAIQGHIWLSSDEDFLRAYDNMAFAWEPLKGLISEGVQSRVLRADLDVDVMFAAIMDVFSGALRTLRTDTKIDPRTALIQRMKILLNGARH